MVVRFNNTKRDCPIIIIEGTNYLLCEKSSEGNNFWGNSKKGKYGEGLCKTDKDRFKPARTGRLGELAVAQFLGVTADFSYRENGDNHDLIYKNNTIDVKTATRNYGKGLIYQRNQWGKEIPLNKDVYVFSFVKKEDRANKYAEIILIGYLSQDCVRKCEIARSRIAGAKHLNYEVKFCDTISIEKLL